MEPNQDSIAAPGIKNLIQNENFPKIGGLNTATDIQDLKTFLADIIKV